jgi:hypothetical protein
VDIYRDGTKDSRGASSSSSLVGDDLVTCQPGYVTEKPLPECEEDILEIVAKEVP